MEFVDTFLRQAREFAGYEPTAGAVLAISGGPDSMALLDLHHRLNQGRFVVAHLDHRLRPDSAEDATFVRTQAEARGFAFVGGVWVAPHQAGGIGVEAAARAERYRFLASAARHHGLSHVATGHHLDDQIETVLHRIIRGAGPGGLRGIHARRPLERGLTLVRPMLGLRRAAILDYLERRGLPWREDPTNRDGGNLRGTIRARLLPFLERGVSDLPLRLAELSTRTAEAKWPDPPKGALIPPEVLHRPLLLRKAIGALLGSGAPPLEAHTMWRIRKALVSRSGKVELGRGYGLAVKGATVSVRSPDGHRTA